MVGDQEVELLFLLPGVDANRYPYQEEAEYIQSLLENIEGTHIKVSIQQNAQNSRIAVDSPLDSSELPEILPTARSKQPPDQALYRSGRPGPDLQ